MIQSFVLINLCNHAEPVYSLGVMQDFLHPYTVSEKLSFWRPWRQDVHVELRNVTDSNLRLQYLHLSQPEADLEEAEQVLFKVRQEAFLIQVDD